MSTLILTDRKTSGPSAGVQVAGEIAIFARGVFDGATVEIEAALSDTPAHYVPCSGWTELTRGDGAFVRPGMTLLKVIDGNYWVRVVVLNAGPKTNSTVETNYGA